MELLISLLVLALRLAIVIVGLRILRFAFLLYEAEERQQRKAVQNLLEDAWIRINDAPGKVSTFARESVNLVSLWLTRIFGARRISLQALFLVTAVAVFSTEINDALTVLLVKPEGRSLTDDERLAVMIQTVLVLGLVCLGARLLVGQRKWVRLTGYVLVVFTWFKGFVMIPADAHPEAVALQYALNISWLLTPACSLVVLILIRIFLALLLKKHTGAFRIVVLMSAVVSFAFGSLVWLGWIVFGIAILDPDISSVFANVLYETGTVSFLLQSPLSLLYSFHLFSTATILLSAVFAGIFLSGTALMIFGMVWPWVDRMVYAVQRFALFRNRPFLATLGLFCICIGFPMAYPLLKFIARLAGIDLPELGDQAS